MELHIFFHRNTKAAALLLANQNECFFHVNDSRENLNRLQLPFYSTQCNTETDKYELDS